MAVAGEGEAEKLFSTRGEIGLGNVMRGWHIIQSCASSKYLI